ncbi:CcoQ/FixQ family Cbb3-type cytochrome c oxidase assembly chaperone [Brackiella oedipodis]|uniref:CcoQ/FixQ family Cbb3-type cytochrome c oxidase assembly chaperone n=1 Tax=Brackiella oedipodis TaxID=124225 RepID=UPI000492072A|nr:CcoQ/FixQ family Cbb3-type cytochrome c oxidase assembly chaperone [Brackiella oedipodis]
MAILNGIVTIMGMVLFIGIVWWAYSAGRKRANEEASMLPFSLEDEADLNTGNKSKENHHE